MSWLKSSSSANSLKDSSKQNSRPRTTSAVSSKQSNSNFNGNHNAAHNAKTIRVIASGTVYLTHTLSIPTLPSTCINDDNDDDDDHQSPSLSIRARKVTRARGGPAVNVLSVLAQFNHPLHQAPSSSTKLSKNPPQTRNSIECALVAPLGGAGDGKALLHELELEGIRTRFARVHPKAGIPSAWVLDTDDPTARAVINHNPLPELAHEDFVALLGPILVPEHYNGLQSHHWHSHPSLPQFPPTHAVYGPGPGLPPPIPPLPEYQQQIQNQLPSPPLTSPPPPLPLNTPGLPNNPPFTCLLFTGRHKEADKTTLLNVTGVDSLARHRIWRSKTTFALDCTGPVGDLEARRARESVFRHVDVVFFSKAYALSTTATSAEEPALTPRAFLLSQVPHVAPHALLFVHWGQEGSAVLSLPTREYLQCAAWTLSLPNGTSTSTSTPALPHPLQAFFPTAQQQTQDLQPPHGRPETQLSFGSSDPRYEELSPVAPPFPFPGHQRLDSSTYTADSYPTPHTGPQWTPNHNTEYSVDSLGGMGGTGMGGRTDWDDVYGGMGLSARARAGSGPASPPPRPSRQVNEDINGNQLNIQMNTPLASSSVHEHIDSLGHALEDESSLYHHDPWSGRGRSRERGRNTNRDAVIYDSDSSTNEYGDVRNIVGIGVRGPANNQANGANGGDIRVSGVTIGYSYSEDSHQHHHHSYAQGQERGQVFDVNVGDAGMMGVALAPSDVDSDADAEVAAVASRFVLENRSRRENPKPFDHQRGESDAFEPSEGDDGRGEGDEDLTEGEDKAKAPTRIGKKRRERLRAEAEAEAETQQEAHTFGEPAHEEEEEEEPFEEDTVEDSPIPPAPRVEKTPPVVLEAWVAGLIYSLTRHLLPGKPYVPGGETTVPKEPKNTSKRKIDFSEWEWKWRLDECLRFAAELAGRSALRGTHEGLAVEMREGAWMR